MKRIAPAAFVLAVSILVTPRPVPAQTMPQLFQKAKEQVKLGGYEQALQTLATLDAESSRPGFEDERQVLEPSLRFYRGVCESALGRNAEAQSDFLAFLEATPRASLDPAIYPKKVLAAFELARRSAAGALGIPGPNGGGARIPTLTESYARFHPDPMTPPRDYGAEWGSGPVRYLMTADEKREWERLSDPDARSEFITKFWSSRDPSPETPRNEFREEFERRVLFADRLLAQGEIRGSLTDRGMVFVLMGPPFTVGRRPIGGNEDSSDLRRSPRNRDLDAAGNMMEMWHYRRENLPSAAPYLEVDFQFITRRGYGQNVMQRDAAPLTTLEIAKRSGRVAS
jgi:GWxTD domain-containing protein